jgi:acyl-CoA synthetase (AMP-forming)/AMP-acid ligase II
MTGPVLVTAADAVAAQRRAAAGLAALGLREGDRAAVVATPSSAAYLAVAVGALRSGVVPVLVNAALTEPERAAILADADPAVVLGDHDLERLAAFDGPAHVDLADAPRARAMMYTSGTTGRPKGVWTGILDDADADALVAEERELWGFAADDRLLIVSPLHHSAPLRFSIGTLLAGGSVVLAGSVAQMAPAITAYRPTFAFVAPAHLQRLFTGAGGGPLPSLSSFRRMVHAGAPCPEPLKRRSLAAFPTGSVWEFYGSTEGQFTACSPEDWIERPGTVGRARPHRSLSVDDDGTIWCRVPSYARFEYWRDPTKTASAWRGDAFSVGDLGRLDTDGFLYLDGRRDDLIITGGVNVYPLEIEHVLAAHPDVVEVAVFPVDDEQWGQAVWAAVAGSVSDDALTAWMAERLAPYKRPKRIVRIDSLPHSATGKLRRSRLADELGLR